MIWWTMKYLLEIQCISHCNALVTELDETNEKLSALFETFFIYVIIFLSQNATNFLNKYD